MTDQSKTGQQTQGTSMATGAGTSAWPREGVTGTQALGRIRAYLNDELFPVLRQDSHFQSGANQAVIAQAPELLNYLEIVEQWCTGKMPTDSNSGGRVYPQGSSGSSR